MEKLTPIWLKYDDKYIVSSDGQVRSLQQDGTYKDVKIQKNNNGYMFVHLYVYSHYNSKKRTRKKIYMHRLVAGLFVPGKTRYRKEVHHINNNRSDNRAVNLYWVTRYTNMQYVHGRKEFRNDIHQFRFYEKLL